MNVDLASAIAESLIFMGFVSVMRYFMTFKWCESHVDFHTSNSKHILIPNPAQVFKYTYDFEVNNESFLGNFHISLPFLN